MYFQQIVCDKKYLSQFKWIKVFDRSERLSADDCLDELVLEVPRICKKIYFMVSCYKPLI